MHSRGHAQFFGIHVLRGQLRWVPHALFGNPLMQQGDQSHHRNTVLPQACSRLVCRGQVSRIAPFSGSVRTSSAPNARRTMRRSSDAVAGMVSTSLKPLAAAIQASPMPVFPEVGSTSVVCNASVNVYQGFSSGTLLHARSLRLPFQP